MHNFVRDEGIRFQHGDLTQFNPEPCDGIIISDVLHYLMPEQQEALMERCIAAISDGGTFIIRDGVAELQERHKGTKLTEIFSTQIFKFNKTQNELYFISRAFIEQFARKHNLELKELDLTKFTSNVIFVMKKGIRPNEVDDKYSNTRLNTFSS